VAAAAVDTVPPTIFATNPTNGATGAALNGPVSIQFSEPMLTVPFSYTFSPNPGGLTEAWSADSTSVTIGHGPFAFSTIYTVRITSAQDTMLLNLAGPDSFRFTTVGLTTLSTGWTGGSWRLFSVPLDPQDTSALAILGDDLGAYSDSTWRLMGYKPNYGYVERPSVVPGYGYWLASAGGATIDVQGLPLWGIQSVPLDSGWNIVGDPFDTTVTLATARVRWTDTTAHDLAYSDPAVNSVLRQRMWFYSDPTADLTNNGAWDSLMPGVPSHAMAPWQGYAVYAELPCSLALDRFAKSGGAKPQPEFSITWQVELAATMGGWADRGLRIGASPQASPGYDRLDAEKPPLVSDRLAISLPHADWNRGPCRSYLYDFRPPGQQHQWTIRVDAADQAQPVEVDYVLSGRPEAGYHLYLINRRAGQGQEIAGSGAIGCSGNAELSVVYTTSTLDQLDLRPLAFSLNRTYPNPFTDRIDINFQVDRPGRVELAVYNVAGQRVTTLVDGQRPPGFYTAGWRSGGVAAGVYFARLAACGQVQVKKMVKVR
jgi:hypothetical protein